MFWDLNIPYPKKINSFETLTFQSTHVTATAGKRVRFALIHLANIPIKLINAITELAKLIILTTFAALFFGQSTKMNENVSISAKKLSANAFDFFTAPLGFFIPISADVWQSRVHTKLFRNKLESDLVKIENHYKCGVDDEINESRRLDATFSYLSDIIKK